MTCDEARERLTELCDDALDGDTRDAVEAHLRACAECERERSRLAGTVSLLRSVEAPRAPAGFVDRVLRVVRPEPWPRRLARRLFVPLPIKIPAEVAAIVLVGLGAAYVFEKTPELQHAVRVDTVEPRVSSPTAPRPAAPLDAERHASDVAVAPHDGIDTTRTPAQPKTRDGAPSTVAPRVETKEPTAPPSSSRRPLERATAPADSPTAAVSGEPSKDAMRRDAESEYQARRESASPPRLATPPGAGAQDLIRQDATSEPATRPESTAVPRLATPPRPRAQDAVRGDAPSESSATRRPSPVPQAATSPRSPQMESRPAPAPPAAMQGAAPSRAPASSAKAAPVTVVGQLTNVQRSDIDQALTELVGHHGGAVIARRTERTGLVVEAVLPGERYAAFIGDVRALGRWTPERETEEVGVEMRVVIRIGD